MAPKRSVIDDPPSAASSSEDEDLEEEEEDQEQPQKQHLRADDDDEEDDEDDDDEEEEASGKKSASVKSDLAPKPTIASVPPSSSSDEEDEEEESESDDAAETPLVVKPVSSKPKSAVDPPKPKSNSSVVAKPSSSKKRPAEPEKDVKKKSKKVGGDDEEEEEESLGKESEKKSGGDVGVVKPQLFQRLWSDEDEIVILKGMIESIKKGIDPLADQTVFLDSIKKSLHVDGVNCAQLINKIRRLKKKYTNNLKRAKGGQTPTFSKQHEVKSYELMKEIWGGGGETPNGKDVFSNGKKSKISVGGGSVHKRKKLALSEISGVVMPKMEEERNLGMYPYLSESVQAKEGMNLVGGSLMREGLAMLGKSKVEELEERWRKLQAAEMKVYLERVELVRDHTMAVLNALGSSDS